jgi:Icc-related predicted phosphoesterase
MNDFIIKRKYIRNYFIYLIITNGIFYLGSLCFHTYFKEKSNILAYSSKITKIKIGNGDYAKIGIISDLQLDKNEVFINNTYRALKVLKKNNVDVIIVAGDTTDKGKIENYILFNKIYNSVYNDKHKPVFISLMGNHDFNDPELTEIQSQKNFLYYIKSYPNSHYIINNYNFIIWSNDNNDHNELAVKDFSWIKSTIEKARKNKNKEGDPIFVVTHIPPKNTVYGSESIWGSQAIFNVLKDYPEVISISGHSHYSLKNIKSIWQKEFTAINTQSISYVDLDDIYQNLWDIRLSSAKNESMGLIAHLSKENVIFDRIEFVTEEIMEEKWKIDFPIITSNFEYTFEKRNKKIKPIFSDKSEIKVLKEIVNN